MAYGQEFGLQASQALRFAGASAPPSQPDGLVRTSSYRDVAQAREAFIELGVPPGMAEQLAYDDQRIGKRLYLLDNSGSMSASDGHVFKTLAGNRGVMTPSTRWEEVCAMAREHANWNVTLNVPCEFILLNCMSRANGVPPTEGIDYVSFNDSETDIGRLDNLLKQNPPRGTTPLSDRVSEIRQRIGVEAATLARHGQMVFVTIATDGMPTTSRSGTSDDADKKRFVEELRLLTSELPVQLVIRLCTDDDEVVNFYDNIDEETELPLDVLDDFTGEAKQVAGQGNDWFVYTALLHKVREAGTLCKLLDDIDEKRFKPADVRRLVQFLSPDPVLSTGEFAHVDTKDFLAVVKRVTASAAPVYDPLCKAPKPFVNTRKLRRAMRGPGLLSCLAWC